MTTPLHTHTMIALYTLDERKRAVRCDDFLTWSQWMDTHNEDRIVAQEAFSADAGCSTVFLGCDHNFFGDRPHLFETLVWDERDPGTVVERCATWYEAEEMHARIAWEWSQRRAF